jgi:hypothetical protein
MDPEYLQDELKAEVALILCEMRESQVIELWELGKLRFYTVRIILNLTQSKNSKFYYKFRKQAFVELLDTHELPVQDYDTKKDEAIMQIDSLYWYDREILKLYAEHGTYRAVEAVTGIPFESIYKTVQKGCLQIRRKVA